MSDPEIIGAIVADTVTDAIETAQEDLDRAQQTAEDIARAAMETETGRRIGELERRFEEWQSNQTDMAEATSALVLGLTETRAQLELLISQQSPTLNPPSVEDGPRESPAQEEPPVQVVVEPEAPEPPPEPIAPKKKPRRWI